MNGSLQPVKEALVAEVNRRLHSNLSSLMCLISHISTYYVAANKSSEKLKSKVLTNEIHLYKQNLNPRGLPIIVAAIGGRLSLKEVTFLRFHFTPKGREFGCFRF